MTTQTPIKMKRLSIDVPAELHRDLMRYCIDHDTKAADLLRNLIRQTVFKDTGAKGTVNGNQTSKILTANR